MHPSTVPARKRAVEEIEAMGDANYMSRSAKVMRSTGVLASPASQPKIYHAMDGLRVAWPTWYRNTLVRAGHEWTAFERDDRRCMQKSKTDPTQYSLHVWGFPEVSRADGTAVRPTAPTIASFPWSRGGSNTHLLAARDVLDHVGHARCAVQPDSVEDEPDLTYIKSLTKWRHHEPYGEATPMAADAGGAVAAPSPAPRDRRRDSCDLIRLSPPPRSDWRGLATRMSRWTGGVRARTDAPPRSAHRHATSLGRSLVAAAAGRDPRTGPRCTCWSAASMPLPIPNLRRLQFECRAAANPELTTPTTRKSRSRMLEQNYTSSISLIVWHGVHLISVMHIVRDDCKFVIGAVHGWVLCHLSVSIRKFRNV